MGRNDVIWSLSHQKPKEKRQQRKTSKKQTFGNDGLAFKLREWRKPLQRGFPNRSTGTLSFTSPMGPRYVNRRVLLGLVSQAAVHRLLARTVASSVDNKKPPNGSDCGSLPPNLQKTAKETKKMVGHKDIQMLRTELPSSWIATEEYADPSASQGLKNAIAINNCEETKVQEYFCQQNVNMANFRAKARKF